MRRCFAVLAVLCLTATVHADNWPQWRGPTYDGISKETNIASEWGDGKNIVWKLKLPGRSGATPCVWGDRIFLTSMDGNDVVLLCVSTEGKELWRKKVGGAGTGRARADEGDMASPSPSTDGKHVWVMNGNGDMACFDFDGKEVWRFNAQERYGRFNYQFGMHMTPVLHGDRLYLQFIHSKPAWVVAIEKATGKEAWKVERPSDGRAECEHSYASPTIWTDGKRTLLITHGNDYCVGHDLKDGSEVWRLGDLNNGRYDGTLRFVSSPVATPDLIIVPTAKRKQMVALKPDARGKVQAGSPFEAWRYPQTPDVCIPLVHDGLVYIVHPNEAGIVDCIDAKTGEKLYSERVGQGRHRASPVYADGKIYVTGRTGTVAVIKAGRKFEKAATNTLKDEFTASPVIANGRIYLRGFDSLYAISATGK